MFNNDWKRGPWSYHGVHSVLLYSQPTFRYWRYMGEFCWLSIGPRACYTYEKEIAADLGIENEQFI